MKKVLTDEDVATIAGIAAEKAVETYKKLMDDESRRRAKEDSKAKKTKRLLVSYRRLKSTLDETILFTEDEMLELRWKFLEDLMGSAKNVITRSEANIVALEEQRKQDMYGVQCIERAVRLYKRECEKSQFPEDLRRYREVYAMYMDEKPTTVQEISTVENVSEKTVYKDLNIACDAISVYLLGV